MEKKVKTAAIGAGAGLALAHFVAVPAYRSHQGVDPDPQFSKILHAVPTVLGAIAGYMVGKRKGVRKGNRRKR